MGFGKETAGLILDGTPSDKHARPVDLERAADAEMIFSTDRLRWNDTAFPGCPIVMVAGKLEPATSLWLFSLFRSSHGNQTAETYGRHIVQWLRYLAEKRLHWWDVTPDDVERALQKKAGLSPSARTGFLHALKSFYAWCKDNHLIRALPFELVGRKRSRRLAPSSPVVKLPRKKRRLPKVHSVSQFDAVLAKLNDKAPGLRRRNELMCESGRYLGLRRSDVAGLTRTQFDDLDVDDEFHVIVLDPRTTKGGKEREVLAPRLFVKKVKEYISGYRQEVVEAARRRDPRYQEPGALFLNDDGSKIRREYVSKVWKRAAKRAGLDDSRFHLNRHTFGTGVAAAAARNGERTLRTVKDLLGHASESTSATYVHLAQVRSEILAQAQIVNDLYEKDQEWPLSNRAA